MTPERNEIPENRQRPTRRIAEAIVLTGALIGFGIAFPPWAYVGVAALWAGVFIWRLSRARAP